MSGLAFDVELRVADRRWRHAAELPGPGTLVLFGPSGAGKTLTLRALAGLVRPTHGWIRQNGHTLFDATATIDVPPQARGIGYVPQHAALFPHLSVRDNVAFGVRGADGPTRVTALLERLEITALAHRRPVALSGGERQRVAIARALGPAPKALLLDEPFSALDRKGRLDLRGWLAAHIRDLGIVVVLVTHDLDDAVVLGDHLVAIEDGRTVAAGRPADVLAGGSDTGAASDPRRPGTR